MNLVLTRRKSWEGSTAFTCWRARCPRWFTCHARAGRHMDNGRAQWCDLGGSESVEPFESRKHAKHQTSLVSPDAAPSSAPPLRFEMHAGAMVNIGGFADSEAAAAVALSEGKRVSLPASRTSMDAADSVRRAVLLLAKAMLGASIFGLFVGINYVSSALLIAAAAMLQQLCSLSTVDFVAALGRDNAIASARGSRDVSPRCSCRCASRLDNLIGIARAAFLVALGELVLVAFLGFPVLWPTEGDMTWSWGSAVIFDWYGNRGKPCVISNAAPSAQVWCSLSTPGWSSDGSLSLNPFNTFLQTMLPASFVISVTNLLFANLVITVLRQLGLWALRENGPAQNWSRTTGMASAMPHGASASTGLLQSPSNLILSIRSPVDGAETIRSLVRVVGFMQIVSGIVGVFFTGSWVSSLLLIGQGGLFLELTAGDGPNFLKALTRNELLASPEGSRLPLRALTRYLCACASSAASHLINLTIAALAFVFAELGFGIYAVSRLLSPDAPECIVTVSGVTGQSNVFCITPTPIQSACGLQGLCAATSFDSNAPFVAAVLIYVNKVFSGTFAMAGMIILWTILNWQLLGEAAYWAVAGESETGSSGVLPSPSKMPQGNLPAVPWSKPTASMDAQGHAVRNPLAAVTAFPPQPILAATDGGAAPLLLYGPPSAHPTAAPPLFDRALRVFVLQTLTKEERAILRGRGAVTVTGGAVKCVTLTAEEAELFDGQHIIDCIEFGLIAE
jgi:hypothetical protein